MADSELDEPGRAELIRDIADSLYRSDASSRPSALWALLWLSDLSCLEKIRDRVTETGAGPVNEFAQLTLDVIIPWLSKDPEANAKSETITPTGTKTSTPTGSTSKKRRLGSLDNAQSSSPAVAAPSIPSNSPPADPVVAKAWQDSELREATLNRDHCCIITTIENWAVLESAHIYPQSLGSTFWDRLRLFWSEEKVNEWASLFSSLEGTEKLWNRITMNVMVHKAWYQSLFALKHIETSAHEDEMVLGFYWLKPRKEIPRKLKKEDFVKRPLLPSKEASGEDFLSFHNVRTSRSISSGETVTMITDFPQVYPHPPKALIELQWYLHRTASLTAVATDYELELLEEYDYDSDTSYSSSEDY